MSRSARPKLVPALALLVCVLALNAPAQAHKIKIFASAEGRTIAGRVYVVGGGAARGVIVRVFGADGKKVGEAKTDEAGRFTVEAAGRGDHRLVVNTPDGHRAEFIITAAELSGGAPERGATMPAATGSIARRPTEAPPATPPCHDLPEPAVSERLRLLQEQIRRLREEIESARGETRLRDILGGIGYLTGVAGVVFYFLGARRRQR